MAAFLVVCAACGEGPMSVDATCDGETVIEVGDSVEATLTEGDDRFDDAFIDYYTVPVTDSADLTITLRSTEMDPLLLRFDAPGEVAEQDFQRFHGPPGTEAIASITHTFGPGCHLFGASSFTPGNTGAYTLSVDTAGT